MFLLSYTIPIIKIHYLTTLITTIVITLQYNKKIRYILVINKLQINLDYTF